jgi:hypothetical protein
MIKKSRRDLFRLSLGAAQLALLSRFDTRTSAAAPPAGAPTKMLAIWIDGGLHWETLFSPLTSAGITKFIPEPTGGLIPWGYLPAQVENFDRSAVDLDAPGPVRKLRGPVYWNWDMPADAMGTNPTSGGSQRYRPWGYIWADPAYKLYEKTALLVGADQNTASHQSGIVASMCGVAGSNFRSPAVQAVVANAMAARFPDRPIPSVSLGGMPPSATGLPSIANPTLLTGLAAVEPTLTDRRENAWKGLRERTDIADVGVDGQDRGGTLPATVVDQAVLEAVRSKRGISSSGTDVYLERLYDTYKGASRTVARDVLGLLEGTKGWEYLTADPAYPADWTACIGSADACGPGASTAPFDFALQLLKSDLVTSVSVRATSFSNFSFDTHSATGPQIHTNHLHIAFEAIGRMIVELSLTPSSSGGGRTLLDDTVVYVYSDFGRTFPKQGSDHHPATCAVIAGGATIGNQMLGGYDENMEGSPMGTPVSLIEESGTAAVRAPRSQDIAATVLGSYYLESGKDFFIPGGYGIFEGVVRPA